MYQLTLFDKKIKFFPKWVDIYLKLYPWIFQGDVRSHIQCKSKMPVVRITQKSDTAGVISLIEINPIWRCVRWW